MAGSVTLLYEPERYDELHKLANNASEDITSGDQSGLWLLWKQYSNRLQEASSGGEQSQTALPEPTLTRVWRSLVAALISVGVTIFFEEAYPFLVAAIVGSIALALSSLRLGNNLWERVQMLKTVRLIRAINAYQIIFVPNVLIERWCEVAEDCGLPEDAYCELDFLDEERFTFIELVRLSVALEMPNVKPKTRRKARTRIDDVLRELAAKRQAQLAIEAEATKARQELEAQQAADEAQRLKLAATSRVEALLEGL